MGIRTICDDLVAQTLKGTKLSSQEQVAIEAELRSHFAEHEIDLHLEGYSEQERNDIMKTEFGDPKAIGKQFFLAQRRFDRIPLIGPLFYYKPVRVGLLLLLLEIIRNSIARIGPPLGPLLYVRDGSFSQELSVIPFVLVGIVEGTLLQRYKATFLELLQSILFAFTPFLFLFIVRNLSEFLAGTAYYYQPLGIGDMGIFLVWVTITFIPIVLGYYVKLSKFSLDENTIPKGRKML